MELITTKREGKLKAAFRQELDRCLPGFLTICPATRGAPDRAILGAGRTSWWEFKHATPEFHSPGDQELMCMRMAAAGYCRYVIWWEGRTGIGQKTMIVHPRQVHFRSGWSLSAESFTVGFDHRWLCEQVRKVHGL